jgi:hypothetical protein
VPTDETPRHGEHTATGFVCPRCGGALWERADDGSQRFECRIGDAFSALELWIEHCDARNQALRAAARALAENASLAHYLADWARERGDLVMVEQLEAEGASEDAAYLQVQSMLEGLGDEAPSRSRQPPASPSPTEAGAELDGPST